jgi:hypothetical protein
MLPVITELVPDVHDDIQTAQRTGRQPENINKAESPVPEQKPEGRFKIAFEHAGIFIRLCPLRRCRFFNNWQSMVYLYPIVRIVRFRYGHRSLSGQLCFLILRITDQADPCEKENNP